LEPADRAETGPDNQRSRRRWYAAACHGGAQRLSPASFVNAGSRLRQDALPTLLVVAGSSIVSGHYEAVSRWLATRNLFMWRVGALRTRWRCAVVTANLRTAQRGEPVRTGQVVIGSRHSGETPVREMLDQMKVESVLMVPIMVNGTYWGHIGFDDCLHQHEWTSAECDALKLLANLIGAAVTRERWMRDLRQRDAVLQAVTQSAVDIMTAPYLHEAISRSLETVAMAVRADRMLVVEVIQNGDATRQVLLRNTWHAPQAPMDLEWILRTLSNPSSPEVLDWSVALQKGEAVKGTASGVSGGLKDYFARLQLQSTLIVPVMVDGKYWGQINFDDCSRERDWTANEVNILKTLAELIGTAITRERFVDELGKANTIVQNSPTILYRLRGDPAFPMVYISQNVALLGHDAAELIESPTLYQTYVHPQDRARVQTTMVELLRKNAPPASIEYRMLTKSGESRWMENRYTPVRDTNGRLVEVEGIMIDITERKIAEERIALLARTDALTGLANRATFSDRLRQAFAATRRGAPPFAVHYIDLDRFKEVNDTCGHPVGDELLQHVAGLLRSSTREADVVARLGGDEFAILQSMVSDPAAAGTLAGKVVEALSKPLTVQGHELRVGASVGIAVCAPDTSGAENLLSQADQALYQSKESGRGRYCFYSDELNAEAREMMALVADLRQALERDQLELYYQPQVELSSGRIVGMEALIRWNHPTRGLLLPEVILPVAERSGMSQLLGRWVLDGACRQLSRWRSEGVKVQVIAVNVALAQIRAGRDFIHDVNASLERWGLKPGDLELDVTEFILARTTLSQSDVLEELRRMGVCIAIDDFGAQYSSLDYLRTYHVGRLKISRPMVAAATDDRGGAMIRAIVGLASELGIEVVAEGVETEAQRAAIVAMSSRTKGQGHYFSKPMRADDTTTLLRLQALEADSEDIG
jgi:diguanylate cyclase (GGDEF)-like protein/PAS domain S-box-containing protein